MGTEEVKRRTDAMRREGNKRRQARHLDDVRELGKTEADQRRERQAALSLQAQLEALEVAGDLMPEVFANGPRPPVSKLPIGAESYRHITALFARKLDHRDQADHADRIAEAPRHYRKMAAAGQLSFSFATTPDDTFNATTPAVGTTTRRFLLGVWELTGRTDAGEWYEGTATGRELLDTLGIYQPGGADYDQLERMFKTLQTMHVEYDNKRRGAERVRWEFHSPVIWRHILGEGDKARYIWALNPKSVSPITVRWMLGEFDLDTATRKEFADAAKKAGGIVPYPTRYTRERLPAQLDNARHALLAHRWNRTPSAWKILNEWLYVGPDTLNKPSKAVALVFDTLDDLQAHGLIGSYTPARVTESTTYLKRDLRRLKFKLTPPPADTLGLTAEQHDEYVEILEWLEADTHGTKTPKPKRREQLNRAYQNFTPEHIRRVFDEHKRAEDVAGFWETLFPKSRRGPRPKPKPTTTTTSDTATIGDTAPEAPTPSVAEVVRDYAVEHDLADDLAEWPTEHRAGLVDQLAQAVKEFRGLPVGTAWNRARAACPSVTG